MKYPKLSEQLITSLSWKDLKEKLKIDPVMATTKTSEMKRMSANNSVSGRESRGSDRPRADSISISPSKKSGKKEISNSKEKKVLSNSKEKKQVSNPKEGKSSKK